MTSEEAAAQYEQWLAEQIGSHLLEQAKREMAYSTTPAPTAGTETENFGVDIPGTLQMNYDGAIDLVALARFVRETVKIITD
ncbi:hypothetical protein ACSHT2_02535 [Bradyrhizobium sp. PUT101]|uniref:hypothetical protein n=1 Tax=Bradyrhizobium sp. PUT101 TaxID=3447427 RepID=UPI003F8768F4